jgi:hypothetical protein
MKKIMGLSMLLLLGATILVAQGTAPVVLSGYVVDQMCAKGIAKKANPMEKAATHTRECALEEGCAASGYGIFSDGKYYPFDEKGSASAKTLLEKSKRTAGMYFEASGKLADGKLVVATLKEAPVPEKKAEKKG